VLCDSAGGKKGKGRGGGGGGGGGRGVRGVDFGLGIGYNPESNNSSSQTVGRAAAVNFLRTGMMAQFKSSFVPASSNPQNSNSNMYADKRPALSGFVSGGTIGGDANKSQPAPTANYPRVSGANAASQSSGHNAGQRSSDR